MHEPVFGKPHQVTDLVATADGSRVVVTGSIYDELDGMPRTALFEAGDGQLAAPYFWWRLGQARPAAPDGSVLAFLSDRAKSRYSSCTCWPTGSSARQGWRPPSPERSSISPGLPMAPAPLGVAGLGAEMADAQGSGTAAKWMPISRPGTRRSRPGRRRMPGVTCGSTPWPPVSLARVSPDGLNVWEAAWSGPDHVLAITSEQPGEDDWVFRWRCSAG